MGAGVTRRHLLGVAAAGVAVGGAGWAEAKAGLGREEGWGMGAQPFAVRVPQATIDDLRERLGRTRWPDSVAADDWGYGTNPAYLRELAGYWRDGFDWRAQEAALNRFPQFRAEVEGVGLHFVHVRGQGANRVPLLLLHGWPSSFVQMLPIIPLLTDPASHGGDPGDAFDVVAASLPGYGFSDRPTAPGMSVGPMAGLFHGLMTGVLGYERYGVRASDLGAGVSGQLALLAPAAVIGVHTGGTNPYIGEVPADLSAAEREFVANAERWTREEMAYAMVHASKPQTLAFGLNDSPAGLASWIVEKFWRWGDHGGDLDGVFGRDALLTNLTVYWATETINSSIRLYYETVRNPGQWGRSEVPTALLMSGKDMFPTPRAWAERQGRVDRWTEIDRGGHFLEWEQPELVARDLREFFRPLR